MFLSCDTFPVRNKEKAIWIFGILDCDPKRVGEVLVICVSA